MAFNKDFFDTVHSSIEVDTVREKISDKAKWPIFVYDWIDMQPNTEGGLKPAGQQKFRNHYYEWTEIIKGNQSVYLTPTNATTLNKIQGSGKVDPKTGVVDGSYYDVKYSKDDAVVFYGIKTKQDGGDDFGTTSFGGFGEFTTISDSETIQMITKQKVSKALLTKFFFIPDIAQILENNNDGQLDQDFNDNDIFYIESYTNHFNENTGEFAYSEITFANVKQNMEQSGQVIEQHIYLASPGAGYLIPKILFNDNGAPIGGKDGWEWNTEYTDDHGVKTIQIESTGNFALSALEIWGYPRDPQHNKMNDKRWYAPRKLLVENFKLPLEENFYKVSSDNSTMDIIDGQIEATADLQSYKTMMKDYIGDQSLDYQLILGSTKPASTDDTKMNTTSLTNPKGVRVNDLTFGFKDDFIDNSLKISDPSSKNTDMQNINVRDSSWFFGNKKLPKVDLGQTTIDLRNVQPNLDESGKPAVDDGKTVHSAKNLLNLMSFALNPINRLPLEINTKLTWSVQDFPGFGKYVNQVLFGMNPAWRKVVSGTDKLMPNLQTLPMFINHNLYKLANSSAFASSAINGKNASFGWDPEQLVSSFKDAGKVSKIPGYFFQRSESDKLGAILSNKSNSTAFAFTLTDKMRAQVYDENTGNRQGKTNISTVLLDQEDGDRIFKVSDDMTTINADGTDETGKKQNIITDVNGDAFIITNIGIKGIGDGDIRITCFDVDTDNIDNGEDYHDHITFQTYMKSTAAYKNGQIREWFSNLNTSFLDVLDAYSNETFNWPKQLSEPRPEKYNGDIQRKVQNIPALYSQGLTPGIDGTFFWWDTNEERDEKKSNIPRADLLLYDFSTLGYKSIDEIKKNYHFIKINSDPIVYQLGKLVFTIGYDANGHRAGAQMGYIPVNGNGTYYASENLQQVGPWTSIKWVPQMDTEVQSKNVQINSKFNIDKVPTLPAEFVPHRSEGLPIMNTLGTVNCGIVDFKEFYAYNHTWELPNHKTVGDDAHLGNLNSDLRYILYYKEGTLELHMMIYLAGKAAGISTSDYVNIGFGVKPILYGAMAMYVGSSDIRRIADYDLAQTDWDAYKSLDAKIPGLRYKTLSQSDGLWNMDITLSEF